MRDIIPALLAIPAIAPQWSSIRTRGRGLASMAAPITATTVTMAMVDMAGGTRVLEITTVPVEVPPHGVAVQVPGMVQTVVPAVGIADLQNLNGYNLVFVCMCLNSVS